MNNVTDLPEIRRLVVKAIKENLRHADLHKERTTDKKEPWFDGYYAGVNFALQRFHQALTYSLDGLKRLAGEE